MTIATSPAKRPRGCEAERWPATCARRSAMFHVLYGDTEMAGAVEAVRDVVDEREGEESEERRLIGFNSSTGYPASPVFKYTRG